ncbi:MAG: universal stress protein [Bacteroidales bacterium]|jgi:nucleotide-binding universal stress UspA family protein|nr:universal stress protein [Bacteroidales bacterium]MDI9576392.1 universal stress protein [Bacteroidota bacterium]MDD3755440.1 universal stress protein [Bacteroidales bacterium]MDY0400569.1 universal stress protein [Bacteroidales bacterium]HHW58636.1 universal stress protein [Bacteroidales bacterium]
MKNFLVGIDFSKGSIKALEYAVMLNKYIDSKITMLYVDKPIPTESIYATVTANYRSELHQRFEQLLNEFRQHIKEPENLEYKITTGKVYEELANYAKKNNVDYIFAGTHGISGYEELWIGSNANRIVSTAPCPVFIVRQTYEVHDKINSILLPIDSTAETTNKLPWAIEIAKNTGAEIHIFGAYITDLTTLKNKVNKNVAMIESKLETENINFKTFKKNISNYASDLITYIEENNIDLAIIMTEQENRNTNILLGQYAMQMINHCPVPVLSIHQDDKYNF